MQAGCQLTNVAAIAQLDMMKNLFSNPMPVHHTHLSASREIPQIGVSTETHSLSSLLA